MPPFENVRKFTNPVLTKIPRYARLFQHKKLFSSTAYKNALAWLYFTSHNIWHVPFSVSLADATFQERSEKGKKKIGELNPILLHCNSFDAFLTTLLLSFTPLVWTKAKILHFQHYLTTMLKVMEHLGLFWKNCNYKTILKQCNNTFKYQMIQQQFSISNNATTLFHIK